MYEKIFESTKLVTPGGTNPQNWTKMIFVTPWDAFFCVNTFELARVFRDGTKVTYGIPYWSYIALSRVGGYISFWNPDGRIYGAYEINGLPNPNEVLNPDWLIDISKAPSQSVGAFIDDKNQRYLRQPNVNVVNVYDLSTGTLLGIITHNTGAYFKTIAWVQEGQVAGICGNGDIKILDYLWSLSVIETGSIDSHLVAAYDNAFGLFVSIGTDYRTRVYCRATIPYNLTNPLFDPPVTQGLLGNTVMVRLTDSDGQPCPDRWVNWELVDLGSGIIGYLDKAVSKTDADGYAWNIYYGPEDNSPGSCKLRASIEVDS
jgi:hypothetical protein